MREARQHSTAPSRQRSVTKESREPVKKVLAKHKTEGTKPTFIITITQHSTTPFLRGRDQKVKKTKKWT